MVLPTVVILGPTAGGKSALAIELAERLPGRGEIVSADSMQIYRGMDIGTAKPVATDLARVPHHLVNMVEPSEDGFTVDTWLEHAEQAVAAIRRSGRWPIVVGGTNLYVKALVEGLFDGPEPDPNLRRDLASMPIEAVRAELARVDPQASARIHPNDRRRSIRALEVFRISGRPISDLQQQWDRGRTRPDLVLFGLEYSAEVINRRINNRVRAMIDAGLADEVRRLHVRGFGRQSREALGYRQLIEWIEGRCTFEEAVEQVKIQSRRYAKQQRTWLRRFRLWPQSCWLPCDDLNPDEIADRALKHVTAFADKPIVPGQDSFGSA